MRQRVRGSRPRIGSAVTFAALLLAVGCSTETPGSSSTAGGSGAGQSTVGGGNQLGGSSGVAGAAAGNAGASSGGSQAGLSGAGAGGTSGAAAGGAAGAGGGAGTVAGDFCSARAGLTFCDSFEKPSVGTAVADAAWAPSINGDGTVTIDDSVAHSGKHSLKVHGSGFSTFFVLSGGAVLPPSAGPLYARAFVRLNEAMTGGHNTFLVADQKASPGTGNAFRLGEMNAMLMYTVSGDTHGALANDNYYTDHLPGAALTPQSWGCLELELDHQKPEIRVWLESSEIADLHHTDFPLDAYDALRFGFEKYAGPVTDVWYDDVALGSAPIGCQ